MFKEVNPKQNFAELEEEILRFWQKNKTFDKSVKRRSKNKSYVFYDGPPFATGLPHYGHILASTVKDIVPRYWTMKGFRVERKWGWDCHGLPIENLIEKELGLNSRREIEKYGIDKFNFRARQAVLKYDKAWEKIITRIGRWVDFKSSYQTMDNDYIESIWWAFKQLYNQGLVYQGQRSSLYCPRCSTALSKFEIAMDNSYKMVTEQAVFVKFKIKSEKLKTIFQNQKPNHASLRGKTITQIFKPHKLTEIYFLAWTTTPWTLPANVGLAVKPSINYALAKNFQADEIIIISADRLKILDQDNYSVISTIKGKDLVGLEYEPLFGKAQREPAESKAGEKSKQNLFKVWPAGFVTTNEGTGIVHIATGYGEDDFNLGLEKNLPAVTVLDEAGKYNVKARDDTIYGQLFDCYFKDANKIIVKELKDNHLLLASESITHSYPFCWRCETALYYTAQDAWFVKVSAIKQQAIKQNRKINWYPKFLKFGRFKKGLISAPDWNISRSRFWGAPLPIWRCNECGRIEAIGSVAELRQKAHQDHQWPPGNLDLHRPGIDQVKLKCNCGSLLVRLPDVFDCWFESGSMPFASRHYPFQHKKDFEDNFPAQFISEYIAQTRGWFYTLHILSTALFKQPAFLNAVTTGTIMAEDGSKMSKSKNNFPDPMILINQASADALRLYLMTSNVMAGEKMNFSVKEVKTIAQNIILRLWNAYNFFVTYARIDSWSKKGQLKPKHILDIWILSRLQTLIKRQRELMDGYQIMAAAREFEVFIDELTNWYIRRSRRRFWKSDSDQDKEQAYQTLYTVLVRLSQLLAPFTPFLSEAIYQNLTGEESVHLSDYPQAEPALIKPELENQMAKILAIVRLSLNMRNQAGIKVRQPLSSLQVFGQKPEDQTLIDLIKDELNVKQVEFITKLPEFVSKTVVLNLPVLGKKYGADLALIQQASSGNKLSLSETGKLELGGFVLNSSEFSLKYVSKKDNWPAANEGGLVVLLNTELNSDLIAEGQARDLIRQLQEARKKQGLAVDDRIIVVFDETRVDKNLINKFSAEIKKEILAKELKFARVKESFEIQKIN